MKEEPKINRVHDPRCRPRQHEPHYQRVLRIDPQKGPILQCMTCGRIQEPKTGVLR